MSVRVCPVCDKKMNLAHFCTNCKTFIKEPVYWNKMYNLNGENSESTIVNQCENHDHTRENATGKVRSDYNTTVRKKQDSKVQKTYNYNTAIGRQADNRQRQIKKRKNPILTLVLIYIMIQFFLPLIAVLLNLFIRF